MIGRFLLWAMGWRVVGELPNREKMVAIVAPHTSNWDWVIGTLVTFAIQLRANYFAKHTLFKGPLGWFVRWRGGIPIDRTATQGVVEQMIDAFSTRDHLFLGLAPEGTRKQVHRWKTGFYRIALGAGVPIALSYFDYPRKEFGFGPAIQPTGDMDADFARIQEFYLPFRGRRGERVIPASGDGTTSAG
jgi:1-acyl-sn-glycerol-3-phosphate acyltransferase